MTQLCSICPRGCGVDRAGGQFGFCAVPDAPVVARAAPHFGEEPCISGTRGSGAVFFSGCNLRCVFCQNRTISRGEHGKEITVAQLGDIFLRLRDEGVHNIHLVTPSHYTRRSPGWSLASRSCGTARATNASRRCACSTGSCRYICRT